MMTHAPCPARTGANQGGRLTGANGAGLWGRLMSRTSAGIVWPGGDGYNTSIDTIQALVVVVWTSVSV